MPHFGPSRMNTAIHLKKSLADAVRGAMTAVGLSVTTAAAKIGCDRKVVRRLLDHKDTAITFKTVDRVTKALKLKPELTVRPLPLEMLTPLIAQLAATNDKRQAHLLRKRFLAGYYGKPVRLSHAQAHPV